jgi:hypothetical protein
MMHTLYGRRFFTMGMAATLVHPKAEAYPAYQVDTVPPELFRLVREFKATQAKAVSPDGRLLCLNQPASRGRYGSNVGRVLGWPGTSRLNLVIVEIGSWREKLVRPLPDDFLWRGSFDASGDRFLIDLGLPQPKRLLLSLPSYDITELKAPNSSAFFVESVLCDRDRLLQHELPSPALNAPKTEVTFRLLQIKAAGELHEINRLPRGYFRSSRSSTAHFSLDRFSLLHPQGDNRIVCRSPRTLEECWTYTVPNDFEIANLGLSPNGKFVVCNLDGKEQVPYNQPSQRRQSILVLDGGTGSLRHQINRKRDAWGLLHKVAITNDGSLIAIESEPDPRWSGKPLEETLIQLVEASTGRVLQTLLQCETAMNDRLFAGISSLQFTPDGQYLVSSGSSTRVWQRNSGS